MCFLCDKCKGKLDFKGAIMGTLYSWVGHQDYRAILSDRPKECAIGSIIYSGDYNRVILIADYKEKAENNFESISADVKELQEKIGLFFQGELIVKFVELENPTLFAEVYLATRNIINEFPIDPFEKTVNDFNVTSGTPTMQMVWLLLSKTLNCRTLSSSAQEGVTEQEFPFEIEADFVPENTKKAIVDTAFEKQKKFLNEVRIDQFSDYGDLRFTSKAMITLYNSSIKAGTHTLPVCIVGEPGTEKKAIAELIHDESDFGNGDFIELDCKSVGSFELDNLLFDPKPRDQSIISKASNGTLYLSNIEHLSSYTQRKLTTLLNIHENLDINLKSAKVKSQPFRLIVSTSQDLAELMRKGDIDEEFFS